MKFLHITMKPQGGAATGAVRTHEAMLREGMDSRIMFMFHSATTTESTSFFKWAKKHQKIRLRFWQMKKLFGNHFRRQKYSSSLRVHLHPEVDCANVIVLHQIDGFVDLMSFARKSKRRIIWRCPDFSPITRGKPYPNSINFDWTPDVYSTIRWVFTTSIAKRLVDYKCPYPIKSFMIYNPLPENWQFKCKVQRTVVLFCSADLSTKRKGFDLVYELWKSRPDFPLLIAVGANDIAGYEGLTNLQCVGKKTPRELIDLYCQARFFLTPAKQEMFGQTTAEALSLGTPVISNRTIGGQELIRNDDDGIIVDLFEGNDDLLLLAQACEEMLSKKIDYQKIAKRNNPRFQGKLVRNYNIVAAD